MHRVSRWEARRPPTEEPRLTPRARAVLVVLVAHVGAVVDRAELCEAAEIANPRTCDNLLVEVRKVLGRDAVQCVRKRGWRLDPRALGDARRWLATA